MNECLRESRTGFQLLTVENPWLMQLTESVCCAATCYINNDHLAQAFQVATVQSIGFIIIHYALNNVGTLYAHTSKQIVAK